MRRQERGILPVATQNLRSQGEVVVIELIGSKEKLVVNPDPARVRVGAAVHWVLRFGGGFIEAIKWEVYFRERTPFHTQVMSYTTKSQPNRSGLQGHDGTISAGTAERPGDYKYGVRVSNGQTGEKITDDDPWLIVYE